MTCLYFVRHAQPNYDNHDDLSRELSEKGSADCFLVNGFFREMKVDAVLSSPFKRAYDTVKGVAAGKGLEIEVVDDFRERRVDDVWIPDFNTFARMQWEDFDFKLAGGECLREVRGRNIKALDAALDKYRDKTVVIGSHGTAISVIIDNYVPDFGYAGFESIRRCMPWIARFDFEGKLCRHIEGYDLFTGEKRVIMEK